MSTVLPTDIYAARQIGLELWLEQVSWPISERAFRGLNLHLDREFDRAHAALDETWRDLLLADLGYIHFLAQYCHAQAVAAHSIATGCSPLIGKLSAQYYEPSWDHLGDVHWISARAQRPRFRLLRQMRRRVIYNRHLHPLQAWAATIRPGRTWSLGALSNTKLQYLREHELVCDFPFLESLMRSNRRNSVPGSNAARDVLSWFLSQLSSYCLERFGCRLAPDLLLGIWMRRLESLYPTYEAALASKSRPDTILIGSAGDPFIRTVTAALRRGGTKSVFFQHGYNMGYTQESARSYMDVSMSDEFVCASEMATRSLSHLAQDIPFTRKNRTKFISVSENLYQPIWDRHKGTRTPGPVRSVMLLGFPMNANRYVYGTALFWNFRLALELRIVRVLRESGIRVLYRPHPDTLGLMSDIMKPEVDAVVQESFETSYEMADALLFTYPLTTTFGFSMCTEKPIVMIDMEGEAWYADIYSRIQKRCVMVPGRFDDANRVVLEAEKLISALREAPGRIDYDYVCAYLFSRPQGERV